MRLFLAIDIPPLIKDKINKMVEFLRNKYPQFSWVSKENYHITLFFFGEVKNVDLIKKKIEDLIYDQEQFNLYSLSVNLFIHRKIIIYINFSRERRIENLTQKIKETFYFVNQKKLINKRFIPHLTLARARIPSKQQYLQLKKQLNKIKIDFSLSVKKIILYQSLINGQKPFYKKIAVFPLLQS